MKKILFFFLSTLLFVACSSDDENSSPTGIKGKPSSFAFDNNTSIQYYYTGNKISETRVPKNSIQKFTYENGELVAIYTSPDDKDVADGHGSVKFKRNGNAITIEAWGEPSSSVIRWELEVDKNDVPVKITELGTFTHNSDGNLVEEQIGNHYALFTYDSVSKNLIGQTVYLKENSQIVASYSYEYDNKVGIFSKVDLPLWYYAYRIFDIRNFAMVDAVVYLNYNNNIAKKTQGNSVLEFKYQYDDNNAPISMTLESAIWGNSFTIAY